MLIRQKILLGLMAASQERLDVTPFVKLAFLIRMETRIPERVAYYDFVPYRYGPFSFALYRELGLLRRYGYVTPTTEYIELSPTTRDMAMQAISQIPTSLQQSISYVMNRYSSISTSKLLRHVYSKYPWYAINSELVGYLPPAMPRLPNAPVSIYTAGYQGKSVDEFLNDLLKTGIKRIIDIRANPVSRSYGFAKISLCSLAQRLGIEYEHVPELGIPSEERRLLRGRDSYTRLLDNYERNILPTKDEQLCDVAHMMQAIPTALLCVERDAIYCHRSKVAYAISKMVELPVVHLR